MRGLRAPTTLLRGSNGLLQASRRQAWAPLAARMITAQQPAASLPRPFSQTAVLDKKKRPPPAPTAGEAAAYETDPDDVPGSKHPKAGPSDALDFADVASRFASLSAHHLEILRRIQSGDRFSAAAIGALAVHPDKNDPASVFPLRELAEIVPRPGGRTVSLLLHERGYVKPVMTAVQTSPDFNQQPQRDPDNELELVLRVEPQSRDDIVRRAKDTAQAWRDKMRSVTEKRKKSHAKWAKEGLIVPDLRRKADAELQKLQDKEMKAVDSAEQQTIKKIS